MLNLPGKTFDRQAIPLASASDYLRRLHAERQERLKRMATKPKPPARKALPAIKSPVPFGPYLIAETARIVKANAAHRAYVSAQAEAAAINKLRAADIIAQAERRFCVPRDQIISDGRTIPVIRARHWAIWETARITTMSLSQIGRAFGGKDHTTILHAIRRENERQGASVRCGKPHEVIDLPAIPLRGGA